MPKYYFIPLPDLDSLSRQDLIRLLLDLQRQLEELRHKQSGSAAPFSKGKRKTNPQPPLRVETRKPLINYARGKRRARRR